MCSGVMSSGHTGQDIEVVTMSNRVRRPLCRECRAAASRLGMLR